MSSTIVALIIEFVMGVIIGLFNNSEERITFMEGILATAVFVGVNGVTYIAQPSDFTATMIVMLFVGWIAVWAGLFVGNATRHELAARLFKPFLGAVPVVYMNNLMAEFLRQGSRLVYFNSQEEKNRLLNTMGAVDSQIEDIMSKFETVQNQDVIYKFAQIKELCHSYFALTQAIVDNKASADIISQWTELGDALEAVSKGSMLYAESEIKKMSHFHIGTVSLLAKNTKKYLHRAGSKAAVL